jgi:hypothetical protein
MLKKIVSLFFVAVVAFFSNAAMADTVATSGSTSASNSASFNSFSSNSKSQIPLTLPGTPGVAVPTPQVFGFSQLSNPTNINGIDFALYFEDRCAQDYVVGGSVVKSKGESGDTRVVFAVFPDYQSKSAVNTQPGRVLLNLPSEGQYVCLGTVQVIADKGKEASVNISVVRSDLANFAKGLVGYSEVYLYCPKQTVGTGLGVATEAGGYSLAALAAGVSGTNPALGAVLGAAGAFSKSDGSTFPDGRIGATCGVLGKPNEGTAGVTFYQNEYQAWVNAINQAQLEQQIKTQQAIAGSAASASGKKLEATK